MAKTIIALFDSADEAQRVVQDLADNGLSRNDISIVANNADNRWSEAKSGQEATERGEAAKGAIVGGVAGLLVGASSLAIPGIGPAVAAGPLATTLTGAGVGLAAGGLVGALMRHGVPEQEAHLYAEGVRRGGALVTAITPDDKAPRAIEIMRKHGAVDIDRRSQEYRRAGFTGFDAKAQPWTREQIARERERWQAERVRAATAATAATTATASAMAGKTAAAEPASARTAKNITTDIVDHGAVIPVIEEQLHVDKRVVQTGGVRVFNRIVEQPVQQEVRIHEEHVHVERHVVDRPLTAADQAAFQERAIEMRETAEQPVVSKTAHVIEEISIVREGSDHLETVRDTLRHNEVDVRELNRDELAEDTELERERTARQAR